MDRSGLRQLLADIAQAQREACEAFIASQRHEGWILPACRLWRRRVLRRDHGSARSATAARGHHGGSRSFDLALVPKVGATLVRQWRGHDHTVLVRDDGLNMRASIIAR